MKHSSTDQNVTFLHTSDFQLGMHRRFLDGDAGARFEESRLLAIEKLGELAQQEGCAFILVAGDVFDDNSLERRTLDRALETMQSLPVPVYLLPGNHDPLVADSIFFSARELTNIHVIDNNTPQEVADGVELVGAPLLVKNPDHDLVAAALEGLKPTSAIRVMVGHGQVESYGDEIKPDLIDLNCVETALASGTIDYLALGDTHSTASLGTTGKVWFSGAPETTDFHKLTDWGFPTDGGETDSGNALVVSITKPATHPVQQAEVSVVKHAIGQWQFHALQPELDDAATVDGFLNYLHSYDNKRRTVVKYYLHGALSLTDTMRLERELADLRPSFGALYESRSSPGLNFQPEADELENLDVSGYARAALEELLNDADHDYAARDGAHLLFRLTKEARR
ncbi:DNA repair exonuclease [Corynebacterium propinquum]|uniref:metallophosphoesterase family protein n=2 Tax=Corynebacterium propinquum TaxID=43769 RepID=UPI0009E385B9|nr:metallophosphoesterase [Corynebacterium propinquum]RUP79809.1 DNA repair exonuclease [Corynebacterium propinquum]RUP89929.1 DNA repair exonuclease [Corynebacterium propinquum]RUP96483.1 DNA repair exonuclease [Corynebacterium propinquum]